MKRVPLHFRTIADLARGLRAREFSPVELAEHYLSRIDRLDGGLNAYRVVCRERVLEEARASETRPHSEKANTPLDGIPYATKDLFDVDGMPTSAGASLLAGNIAKKNATVVDRLYMAGMPLLGKTNTVQLAYSALGINHDHGTPRNPWHAVPHIPGGSSSGSAVAVAAGLAPMALGTDTGGSIRCPAALCGVTGLKTTVGRISRAGVYPLSHSMDSVGFITRSVKDAAILYDAVQDGPDPADESTTRSTRHDVLTSLRDGVRGLRLGIPRTVFMDDLDPDVEAAFDASVRVFEGLGARFFDIAFSEAKEAWDLNRDTLVVAYEAYAVNRELLDNHFDELDPVVAHRMIRGKEISESDYRGRVVTWNALRLRTHEALHEIDALLVPTTRTPAVPVAEVDAGPDVYARQNASFLRNTCIGNLLNLCGVSVPCGFSRQELPLGLTIYGKPFQEEVILRAGYAFQQATDWHQRTPDDDVLADA